MKILHDLHIHTYLSLCGDASATPEAYVSVARDLGMKTLGFVDHVWDTAAAPAPNAFYEKQDMAHIQKLVLPKENGMKLLRGCEADLMQNGTLGLTEKEAKKLDFVLAVHSHSQWPEMIDDSVRSNVKSLANALCDRFSLLVEHPLSNYITAIAHPFFPYGNRDNMDEVLFQISDETLEDLFADAAYKNIALEINASAFTSYSIDSMHRSELYRVYEIAKDCGCKFVFGTDCHNPSKYAELYHRLTVLSDLLEITDADICPRFAEKA